MHVVVVGARGVDVRCACLCLPPPGLQAIEADDTPGPSPSGAKPLPPQSSAMRAVQLLAVQLVLLLGLAMALLPPRPLLAQQQLAQRQGAGKLSMSEASDSKRGVVIVGGGPAGYAAAIMLSRRGWSDITIVERSPSADFFDANLGFSYRINDRGQCLLDAFGMVDKLAAVSVDESKRELTYLPAAGPRKTISANFGTNKTNKYTPYWVLRQEFIALMNREATSPPYADSINVLYQSSCVDIQRRSGGDEGGGGAPFVALVQKAGARAGWEPPLALPARLIVGADGLKSMVRGKMKEWAVAEGGSGAAYDMHKQHSGSTGLKYKVLTLPSGFKVPALAEGESELKAQAEMSYVAVSGNKGRDKLRLGVLPTADRSARRTANIITWPSHPVWTKRTGPELFEYLQKSFPQLPLSEWLTPEVCKEFVNGTGGAFPAPQNCKACAWVEQAPSDSGSGGGGGGGVVVIGDAMHCFPPDLGQGVNAALEDVAVLDECLEAAGDDVPTALTRFEQERIPDAAALTKLMVLGFPWQYKQNPFREKLSLINILFRMTLSKLFPKLFSPQVAALIGRDLRYSEVLRRANRTTRNIALSFAAVAAAAAAAVRFTARAAAL